MLIINILFIISFLISCIFGILSSNDLLPFFNIGNLNIISLHKTLAYITLFIMGLHLGINFNSMFGKLEKKINNKVVLIIIYIVIILFGIYSFIKLDFWYHLIGKYGFSIVTGNIVINVLEYISLVLCITLLTNMIYKKIK